MTCTTLPMIQADVSNAFRSSSSSNNATMIASSAATKAPAAVASGHQQQPMQTQKQPCLQTEERAYPAIQFLVETPHGRTTTVTRTLGALLSRQLQRQEQAHTAQDQEGDYHDLLLDILQACQRRDAPQTRAHAPRRCCSPTFTLDALSLDDDSSCGASPSQTPLSSAATETSVYSVQYMEVDEYIFDDCDINEYDAGNGMEDSEGVFVATTTTGRPIHHHQRASPKKRRRRRVLAARDPRIALVWNGKRVSPTNYYQIIHSTVMEALAKSPRAVSSIIVLPLRLAVGLIVGGIDRQNRAGSKFGGGGVSSSSQSERERKERLKQLALESIDLAKDPYLMRNHLGTYECKLCLTLHTNEANYLAHTQGKKHQQGLARRAHLEKLRQDKENAATVTTGPSRTTTTKQQRIKIGRPAYQVFKSRDPDTQQRCLTFEISYPEIADDIQPRHRFMSAFEQKVESPPDRRYQYLVVAADPYETIAFKVPNEPLDRTKFLTHWKDNKFLVSMYYWDKKQGDGKKKKKENGKDKANDDEDKMEE